MLDLEMTGQEQTSAASTDALPGSPRKVAVLAQRHAERLQLIWHPLDASTVQRICNGRRRQMWGRNVQVY